METMISIISIIIAILGFLLAVFSFKSSREAKYKANRPILTLTELTLFLDKYEVYVGNSVPWGKKKLAQNPNLVNDIMKNKGKSTRLENKRSGNDYLFINACHNKTANTSQVVLALDVLNIKVDFSNNEVSRLRIKKFFSIRADDGETFTILDVDAEFPVNGTTLEVPIAYACIHGTPTSMHLHEIYKLKKSILRNLGKKTINLLQTRGNASDYIAFVETGYLLECKTIDGYIYEYSLYLQINENGTLIFEKIQNGSDLFKEKITGRKDIVQEATKKKGWKKKMWLK